MATILTYHIPAGIANGHNLGLCKRVKCFNSTSSANVAAEDKRSEGYAVNRVDYGITRFDYACSPQLASGTDREPFPAPDLDHSWGFRLLDVDTSDSADLAVAHAVSARLGRIRAGLAVPSDYLTIEDEYCSSEQ